MEGMPIPSAFGKSPVETGGADLAYLLLRLGGKLQRIAFAAAGFRPARGLGLSHVARINGDNADAAPMRGHHHPIGLVLAHAKLALEHGDDELARGVVVVEQDDLVQPRPFRLEANLGAPLGGDVAHCSNASRSWTSFSHVWEGACNSRACLRSGERGVEKR